MDFLGLSDWIPWHVAELVWLIAAVGGYLVLVKYEHWAKDKAIKWTLAGSVVLGSWGYAFHYGAAGEAGKSAGAYFRAAYANAECQGKLAKYEGAKPLTLIIPTALPPKEELPAAKTVDVPGKVPAPAPVKLYKAKPRAKASSASPFAN